MYVKEWVIVVMMNSELDIRNTCRVLGPYAEHELSEREREIREKFWLFGIVRRCKLLSLDGLDDDGDWHVQNIKQRASVLFAADDKRTGRAGADWALVVCGDDFDGCRAYGPYTAEMADKFARGLNKANPFVNWGYAAKLGEEGVTWRQFPKSFFFFKE